MSINVITNRIDQLTQQQTFFKKEVLPRVTAIALIIIVPIETAVRTGFAIITFTAYVISEPFYLLYCLGNWAFIDEYTKQNFSNDQEKYIKMMVLVPAAKAFVCGVCIVLSPVTGLISPRAMVTLHTECGLASLPELVAPIPPKAGSVTVAGALVPVEPDVISPDEFTGMEPITEVFDRDYIQVIKDPSEAKKYDLTLPGGILLSGPPGSGKTYTARNLVRYAKMQGLDLAYKEITAGDIASHWKDQAVEKIRATFVAARKAAPCLLFIDECEGLFPKRNDLYGSCANEYTKEVGEFLQNLQDAAKHKVIVVVATNHPDKIDEAVLRSERIDHKFEVSPPTVSIREKIVANKLARIVNKDFNIQTKEIAEAMEGFNFADITATLKKAASIAFQNKCNLSKALILDCVGKQREQLARERASRAKPRDPLSLLQSLVADGKGKAGSA